MRRYVVSCLVEVICRFLWRFGEERGRDLDVKGLKRKTVKVGGMWYNVVGLLNG